MATAPHRHVQRAGRELLAVARGDSVTHTHLRNRLLSIAWVTIALVLIATVIVFFSERHARGAEIHNLFDALLFSTSQLLAASSVAAPTTSTVKVLELFFDIYAITVVAALAGSFGSFFHRRSVETDGTAVGPGGAPAAAESAAPQA